MTKLMTTNEDLDIIDTEVISDENHFTLPLKRATINGEMGYIIPISTPVTSVNYDDITKVSDILLIEEEEYKKGKNIADFRIGDISLTIYLADDEGGDFYFYTQHDGMVYKCFLDASMESLQKILPHFISEGKQKELYYKRPHIKLVSSIRGDVKLQAVKDLLSQFPINFKKSDRVEIIDTIKAQIYKTDISSKVLLSLENLEIFSKIYGYHIAINPVSNELIINKESQRFSSETEALETFKDDLQQEEWVNVKIEDLEAKLKVLASKYSTKISMKNIDANQLLLSNIGPLQIGLSDDWTQSHSTQVMDTVLDCITFNNEEEKINFIDTFRMLYMDVVRKQGKIDTQLVASQSSNTQFLYIFIASNNNEIIKLLDAINLEFTTYPITEFDKLLNGKIHNHNSICFVPKISDYTKEDSLFSYLNNAKEEIRVTKTQSTWEDKSTVLIGALEDGDTLPFDIANTVYIRFDSVDYNKLKQVQWDKFIAEVILHHKTSTFLDPSNNDVINFQRKIKLETSEDSILNAIVQILCNYEKENPYHAKKPYNAKSIFEEFGLSYLDTDASRKKLNKILRKCKTIKTTSGSFFKLSSSLFGIAFDDHLASLNN